MLALRRSHSLLFALALVLAGPGLAHATTLTDQQILSQFNAVIFGNFSSTSDVEGAAIVGGNMTGGATFYNNPGPEQSASTAGSASGAGYGALNVVGNISAGQYNMNNGGSVYYGGSNGGRFNMNGGGTLSASPALSASNFASQFQSPMVQLSQSLAAMTANSSMPNPATTNGYPNNVPIVATNVPSGVSVFNISSTDLANLASFNVNLNGDSTVIFNVNVAQSCSSPSVCSNPLTLSANFQNASAVAGNIIWNFYNATSLNFTTAWGGTILAPGASVTNSTQLDGTLVANNYGGNGELHDYPYAGSLPQTTTTTTTTTDSAPVPEPPATLVLLAGLAALGLVRMGRARKGFGRAA